MNPVAIDNSPAQYDTDTTVDVINIKSLRGPKKIFGFSDTFWDVWQFKSPPNLKRRSILLTYYLE